jgi:hypothetical protein
MSTRPRPDPNKKIEDLPDSVTIGNRTFTGLRILGSMEHQQRLAILYDTANGCGCTLGGLVGIAALLGYLAAGFLSPASLPGSFWGRAVLGLAALLVGAGLGKLLGQLHVKRRFDRAAYDLELRVTALRTNQPV